MVSESCWMRDIYLDFRHIMKFRHAAAEIARHSFADYRNRSGWVLLDGNCLYYHHWLNNLGNVETLVHRGYLASLRGNFRHRDALVKELTQAIFEKHVRFRAHIRDLVDCVIQPFRARLIPAEPRIHAPPFARFSNLIAVHARFGSGLADFPDSREFLAGKKLKEFVACLDGIPSNSMVFVASDSVVVKLAIRHALGDRVFSLPILAGHSDMTIRIPSPGSQQRSRRNRKMEYVGVKDSSLVWLIVDMIVASMGSKMIGTEGSTFSTMIGMMGDPEYKAISKFSNMCQPSVLYLPQ